jgi:ribonuclease Y
MNDQTQLDKLLEQFTTDASIAKDLKAAARELVLEAKTEALKVRQQSETKLEQVEAQQEVVKNLQARLSKRIEELDEIYQKESTALSEAHKLTLKDAEERLLEVLDKQLRDEYARRIRENEDRIRDESDRRAREILITSIQRIGTENVGEYTLYTIDLPDEDIKGRIIGKSGNNIKAFEEATGVSVEIG